MTPGTIVRYGSQRYVLVKPVDNRREWLVERVSDHRIMRMKTRQVNEALGAKARRKEEGDHQQARQPRATGANN